MKRVKHKNEVNQKGRFDIQLSNWLLVNSKEKGKRPKNLAKTYKAISLLLLGAVLSPSFEFSLFGY